MMNPLDLRWTAIATLLVGGAIGSPAAAGELYPVHIDPGLLTIQPSLRPDTSARNLSSLLRGASWAGDVLLDATELETSAHPVLARSLLGAFFDFPLALYAGWFQHEVFGHLRECPTDFDSCRYTVAIPPPFGFQTHLNYVSVSALGSPSGRSAASFFAAGRQAQQLLGDELLRASFFTGDWNRIAMVSLVTTWAERVWETLRPAELRDVGRYYFHLSEVDPGWTAAASGARLLSGMWMLLDPVAWFAAINYAQFLRTGSPGLGLPDFLPGPWIGLLRPRVVELTTGPEWGLQLLIGRDRDLYELTATAGLQPLSWSGSVSARAPLPRLLSAIDLSIAAHLWRRVDEYAYPLTELTDTKDNAPVIPYYLPGGAVELQATWWLLPTVGASARAGFKTTGHLFGNTYSSGPFGELGFTVAPR